MTNAPLENLPRLAQDYTPEQREACVTYLASLPVAELRQRQSIKNEEIERAYTHGPEEILASVQEQAEQIADALIRKLASSMTPEPTFEDREAQAAYDDYWRL